MQGNSPDQGQDQEQSTIDESQAQEEEEEGPIEEEAEEESGGAGGGDDVGEEKDPSAHDDNPGSIQFIDLCFPKQANLLLLYFFYFLFSYLTSSHPILTHLVEYKDKPWKKANDEKRKKARLEKQKVMGRYI